MSGAEASLLRLEIFAGAFGAGTERKEVADSLPSSLSRAFLHARIRRDHVRVIHGEARDAHAFIVLYGHDPYATSEGYVSSAEAMLAAANVGRPMEQASKPWVDAVFANLQAKDIDAVRVFLTAYGSNAYAIMRGYVKLARGYEMAEEQRLDGLEREELLRQRRTEWVWD